MVLALLIGLACFLLACAAKRPVAPTVFFRNCTVTEKSSDGKLLGCECRNPQPALDAKTGKSYVLCQP